MLTDTQIDAFIHDGFVKVDGAFPRAWADEAREILWKDTGYNPDNPQTWVQPVVSLGEYHQEPFRKAANTVVLHAAFDQLVGAGNWMPRGSLGSFPVRFPHPHDPGDTGWHVDASFPGENPNDYFSWRINVRSKGRALLMLFLFSDVSSLDAPTKILAGSHLDVAKLLQPYSEAGLGFMDLATKLDVSHRREVLATGEAGTVYLCHPFIVHAAQPHRGKNPKFMAQPSLIPKTPLALQRETGIYSPVENAIRSALEFQG